MNDSNKLILKTLSSSPSFNSLNNQEINSFSKICSLVNFSPEEIIFSETQPANAFYVLHKGNVQLAFSGQKIIQVSKGQLFGDWAVINDTVRLATAKSQGDTKAIAIDASAFKNPKLLDINISFKILMDITKNLINRLQSTAQISSKILISNGETDEVEFKSTLRKNLFTSKKDPAIEMASIKTIAGFLNASGGVLFIGVDDDGNALGLEADEFKNEDKFLLHLTNLITNKMGNLVLSDIHFSILSINEKPIVRIDCDPSSVPVFVNEKTEEYFFVRNGVSTINYTIKNALEYIKSRF